MNSLPDLSQFAPPQEELPVIQMIRAKAIRISPNQLLDLLYRLQDSTPEEFIRIQGLPENCQVIGLQTVTTPTTFIEMILGSQDFEPVPSTAIPLIEVAMQQIRPAPRNRSERRRAKRDHLQLVPPVESGPDDDLTPA